MDELLAFQLKNLTPEQIRADIGRWKREIQTWRTRAGLTDDHPNIARRLARIRIAERFLDQTGACPRREPHECGDDVEYCERCGGYRPDPHRCDTGSKEADQ